ncbi:MAG: hypothetical protein AB7V08_14990 [Elusimicrobiales bacterium]
MTLKDLCNYFWWLIDDNPSNPLLVDKPTLTAIFNDGIRSLADSIRKIGYVELGEAAVATGIVTMPGDFVTPVLVKYGDTELKPIKDIHQAKLESGDTTQYIMLELRKMQLYDTPKPPYKTLKLWYVKYPTLLEKDEDSPVDIPEEYHTALATVFARAVYALKMGWLSQYQALMILWDDIKREVSGAVEARTNPVRFPDVGEWRW